MTPLKCGAISHPIGPRTLPTVSRHVGTDSPWVSIQQWPTGPSWGLVLSNTTASLSPSSPPSDRFSRCLGIGIALTSELTGSVLWSLICSLWCDTLKLIMMALHFWWPLLAAVFRKLLGETHIQRR